MTKQLNDQLEAARIAAGIVATTGPRPRHPAERLHPRPCPADGNKQDYTVLRPGRPHRRRAPLGAGAEGIAVNGERVLVVSTAIVDVGGSAVVNGAYVARRRTK